MRRRRRRREVRARVRVQIDGVVIMKVVMVVGVVMLLDEVMNVVVTGIAL